MTTGRYSVPTAHPVTDAQPVTGAPLRTGALVPAPSMTVAVVDGCCCR